MSDWTKDTIMLPIPVICTGWQRVRIDGGDNGVTWRHYHAPECSGLQYRTAPGVKASHGMSPECEARWRAANGLGRLIG